MPCLRITVHLQLSSLCSPQALTMEMPDTSITSFSTEGCQQKQGAEACFPQHHSHCKCVKLGCCALHCSLYNAEPSEGHSLHLQGISLLKWTIQKLTKAQGCRPQLTALLLRWKGVIWLKLISTENRAGTFKHLNKHIRHLQPEIGSTFLLPCLLTRVLTTSLS